MNGVYFIVRKWKKNNKEFSWFQENVLGNSAYTVKIHTIREENGETVENITHGETWTLVTSNRDNRGKKPMNKLKNNSVVVFQNPFTPLRIG